MEPRMNRFRPLAVFGLRGSMSARARERRARNKFARIHLCLGAAWLLALAGCTTVKVKLGMKVYLAKTSIASIAVNLPKGLGIAPGEKSPLVVVVTGPDGKVLQTEGKGKGKVMWKDLKVTPALVTANQKGIVSLPRDPRISDGKIAHVTITVPSHPDLKADLDIPVRYDHDFVSNFSGQSGGSGSSGMAGTDGTSGAMGSTDPNNPSAGGNGSNGSDGSNGQDGEPGGDAPPVQVRVRVALRAGPPPLLQVSASAAGHRRLYLVDPKGETLTVKADGGAGGAGGSGGRGGRGGSGGIGTPSGNNGSDGSSGPQGLGGEHHGDLRFPSPTFPECDPPLQPEWPGSGI